MAKLYYEMAELAKILGKTTRNTRNWFRYHGLAKRVGGRWVVTGGKLLAHCPEVFFKATSSSEVKQSE